MNLKSKRLLQRVRVPLGFLFGIIFLYFANPEPIALTVGGIIALGGLYASPVGRICALAFDGEINPGRGLVGPATARYNLSASHQIALGAAQHYGLALIAHVHPGAVD